MVKTAYLAFLAETPMIGLDPHPAWAPQDAITRFDAEGYAEALGAETDYQYLLDEVADDANARHEAVEAGDLEDTDEPDVVFEVAIHDDGRIDVIHSDPRYVLATFSIQDVYKAYGMTMPTPNITR